jgi:alkanesulfonate monooxygenase SsuD/methylene tetrahydromethanopterin reductase-like flavin-dependent oxidoreductase (luciferase family)
MDQLLPLLQRAWKGEPVAGGEFAVGPTPPDGRVPILVGGNIDAAIERTVRYGDGWTAGGAPPEQAGQFAARIRRAWDEAGRGGEPRLGCLAYYGLGDRDASQAALRRYYGFLGDYAGMIADSAIGSPEAAKGAVQAFSDAGITELAFIPTVASLDEVDRLADAVL